MNVYNKKKSVTDKSLGIVPKNEKQNSKKKNNFKGIFIKNRFCFSCKEEKKLKIVHFFGEGYFSWACNVRLPHLTKRTFHLKS